MQRLALLTLLLAPTVASAQTGLATRQQAVDAINAAVDDRLGWADFVDDVEAEINALPAGPDKDAIELAWGGFVAAWIITDTAADSHIDDANDSLADGDGESNPMLKGLHYATAVSSAVFASNQLALLEDDYDTFLTAISGAGWTPATSPPN